MESPETTSSSATPPSSEEAVFCYSGIEYPDQPRAVIWQGERRAVTTCLASWLLPHGKRFLVRVAGGALLLLEYLKDEERWLVTQAEDTIFERK